MTAIEMFNTYMEYAFAKDFIVGGICGNVVKFDFATADDIVNALTTTTGSDKEREAKTLRFLFSKNIKKKVDDNGITLCTKDEFEELAKVVGGNGRSNRGLAFEKLVTEYFNQVWKADSKKFTECGDIVINNKHYQIKTHKATFTNETALTELSA